MLIKSLVTSSRFNAYFKVQFYREINYESIMGNKIILSKITFYRYNIFDLKLCLLIASICYKKDRFSIKQLIIKSAIYSSLSRCHIFLLELYFLMHGTWDLQERCTDKFRRWITMIITRVFPLRFSSTS